MSKPKSKKRRAPPTEDLSGPAPSPGFQQAVPTPPFSVPSGFVPPAPAPFLPQVTPGDPYAWFFTYVLTLSDPTSGQRITTHANECARMHPLDWLVGAATRMRQGGQMPPVILFFVPVSAQRYMYLCRSLYGANVSPHDQAQG